MVTEGNEVFYSVSEALRRYKVSKTSLYSDDSESDCKQIQYTNKHGVTKTIYARMWKKSWLDSRFRHRTEPQQSVTGNCENGASPSEQEDGDDADQDALKTSWSPLPKQLIEALVLYMRMRSFDDLREISKEYSTDIPTGVLIFRSWLLDANKHITDFLNMFGKI